MTVTKVKLSVSISASLASLLEEYAKSLHVPKSALVERSLHQMMDERLAEDAKKLASLTFDDLPTEDEWLAIQSKL